MFIDEVEEIAVQRGGEPPSTMQGVTNELLKIVPTFRDQPNRLLVSATNFIRSLDSAFLRHERFDYVIPIGLPDDAARKSIWVGYIPPQSLEDVDVDALVAKTGTFSPADIEFAARKASQRALENALYPQSDADVASGPLTEDYLVAIAETKATVYNDIAREFLDDIDLLARL